MPSCTPARRRRHEPRHRSPRYVTSEEQMMLCGRRMTLDEARSCDEDLSWCPACFYYLQQSPCVFCGGHATVRRDWLAPAPDGSFGPRWSCAGCIPRAMSVDGKSYYDWKMEGMDLSQWIQKGLNPAWYYQGRPLENGECGWCGALTERCGEWLAPAPDGTFGKHYCCAACILLATTVARHDYHSWSMFPITYKEWCDAGLNPTFYDYRDDVVKGAV